MPHIPVQHADSPPDANPQIVAQLAKRTGALLSLHAGVSPAPVLLATYVGLQVAIAEHGTLGAKTREAIALTVSALTGCRDCQAAHSAWALQEGWTPGEIAAINGGVLGSDRRLAALLMLAAEATGGMVYLDDAMWQEAQAAGWSTAELAEMLTHVALNLYAHYVNHYHRVDTAPAVAAGTDALTQEMW